MRQNLLSISLAISSLLLCVSGISQRTNVSDQPIELGEVSWYRNMEKAQRKASEENKPIIVLFQEVPGCSTCQNYGDNVLSHPLIVDIIEEEFIPLAIYNNKGGEDAEVLKLYGEPSWNNPVLRVIRADGKNLVTRHSGHYDTASLATYMKLALIAYNGKVPDYVDILVGEIGIEDVNVSEAYYSMYCFWTGEAKLGQVDGVISTSSGFMNGKEVVKVSYDNKRTNSDKISNHVKADNFTFISDPSKFKIDRDPQYYLKKSDYRYIALSPSQRTKINSALASGTDPEQYLSPTQQVWISKIQALKDKTRLESLYDKDWLSAWKLCQKQFS